MLHRALTSLIILLAPAALFAQPAGSVGVFQDNPHYLAVDGTPVFLIGATHEGGWTPVGRIRHDFLKDLDRLSEVIEEIGSEHVRGLVRILPYDPGNRQQDLPFVVQPWVRANEDRFDLQRFSPEWEARFRSYLDAARERGLIVSLEVWDDWSVTRGTGGAWDPGEGMAWNGHPFNPANNVNYDERILPVTSLECGHPFYRSIPSADDNAALLALQQLYVTHLVSITRDYPNILYNVSNESRATLEWSRYWAGHLRELLGPDALIGEMPSSNRQNGEGECDADLNPISLLADERYAYADPSQAVSRHEFGEEPLQQSLRAGLRLAAFYRVMEEAGNVKPLVISKDYTNTDPAGIPVIWAKFVGGAASTRFHRPSETDSQTGSGSSEIVDFQFDTIRHLGHFVKDTGFWLMRPDTSTVLEAPSDAAGALALSKRGEEYVVQLIGGRGGEPVVLDLQPGDYRLRWYHPAAGEYAGPEKGAPFHVDTGGGFEIQTPRYADNLILHIRRD